MDSQDKIGSTSQNSVQMLCSRMDVEANVSSPGNSSPGGFPAKEAGGSGEEHALKIRKPYTITKQRERWTEEEHKKFLEALELYGRAWRRIEVRPLSEHIGTKTTVQIRSHAQKFFTKVTRESSTNGADTVKSIVIPPPRPKRKPLHPYPRKLGYPSMKEIPALGLLKKPLSKALVSEQENRSPTSVLSAFGSEAMSSFLASIPNPCASPVTSASGSNGQENGVQLPIASIEEENTSVLVGPISGGINPLNKSSLVVPHQVPTLRLFGRTVLVTDTYKPSSAGVGIDTVQYSSPPSPGVFQSNHKNIDTSLHSPIQPHIRNVLHGDFLESSIKGAQNPWASGVPPLMYCLPSQKDLTNPTNTVSASVPWWTIYGNIMFPFVDPQRKVPHQSCMEASDDKEMQKEGSWTGSNTAFSEGTGDQNGDTDELEKAEHTKDKGLVLVLRPKPCEESAFGSQKEDYGESRRGFVPYKRREAEQEVVHSQVGNKEERVRL